MNIDAYIEKCETLIDSAKSRAMYLTDSNSHKSGIAPCESTVYLANQLKSTIQKYEDLKVFLGELKEIKYFISEGLEIKFVAKATYEKLIIKADYTEIELDGIFCQVASLSTYPYGKAYVAYIKPPSSFHTKKR